MAEDYFVQLYGNASAGKDYFVGVPGNAAKAITTKRRPIKVRPNNPQDRVAVSRAVFV